MRKMRRIMAALLATAIIMAGLPLSSFAEEMPEAELFQEQDFELQESSAAEVIPDEAPEAGDAALPTAEAAVENTIAPEIADGEEASAEAMPTAEAENGDTPEADLLPVETPVPGDAAEPDIEASAAPSVEPDVEASAAPSVEPDVEASAAPSAEPTIAPDVAPSAEPSAEPEDDVSGEAPVLMAAPALYPPMIVPGKNWVFTSGVAEIPYGAVDSNFKVEWKFTGEAVNYHIQAAKAPAEGEEEQRWDICRTTECFVELPVAAYLDGDYRLYIIAEMADGSMLSNILRFRLELSRQIVLGAERVSLGVGEKFSLHVELGEGMDEKVSFASENAKIATVDKTGLITAKKAGETKIIVTAGELSAECSVVIVSAPTKVTLSAAKLSMGAGQTEKLSASLNNGNESKVTFSSSNKKVATVDENGVVTAIAKGTAKITAASYNNKKATCTVTVLAAPTSISLNEAELTLPAGMGVQLAASVNKNAMASYVYASSNADVAAVDAAGNVTTIQPGVAIITATTYNGLSAACEITVTAAPSAVSLNVAAGTLGVSEKLQLVAANDQGCEANYTYASTNAKVATVDKNGLVTAKKAGTATVTVTAYNGLSAACEITVVKAPTKVTLSVKTLSMGVGQTESLGATLSSGSSGKITFSSSKASVAAVDENGVITAIAAGKATITAKTYNNKKATCTVTVLAAPETLTLSKTSASLPMGMTLALNPAVEKGAMANYVCASSDESIAVVDEKGNVTGVNFGTATITVTTYNGLSASCDIQVTPAPTVVLLNADALELGVKETYQLIPSADQGGDGGYSYKSSKTSVATVDKNGLITAKKAGTATVTVTSFNGVTAECAVTVMKAPSSVKLNAKEIALNVGQQATLQAVLSSGSTGGVSFSSSDEKIATVDADGLVYAVAAGVAKITVKTYNGKTASCNVTVKEPSNIITGLRTEGGAAVATVSTIQACTLLVEVLDENSEAVIMSATAAVEAGLQLADVRAELPAALPAHYVMRGVLQDENGENLCAHYITRRYTSAYGSFESQDPSDFPENRVLNLGKGGYAVYSENTYVVDGGVTESGGSYSFVPPAELKPGNVLIIDGQPVKIKTIVYNPDGRVTVTEDKNIYLADIYDVLNLDMTVALQPNQQRMLRSSQGGVDLVEFASNFSFGPVEIEAKVSMSATVRAFYDKKFFGADYFEYEVVVDAKGSLSTTLSGGIDTAEEDYNDLSLILFAGFIPVSVPGVNISLIVEVPVDMKAEARGKGEVGFEVKSGFKYDPQNKNQPIQSKEIDAELAFEGEFEVKVGPKIEMSVALVCLMGKVTAHAGVLARGELKGVTTNKEFSADKSFFHACDACIDMKISGFAEFKGALEYKITEKLKGNIAELKLFSGEWEIGDAFLSVINEAASIYGGKPHFEFGDCMNRKYRVRVNTQDAAENTVTGMPVSISGSKTDTLNGKSMMESYLYPGSYEASVQFGKNTVKKAFTVPEAALDLMVSESMIDIFGCVTDNNSGKPIPGAKVEASLNGGESYSAVTDEEGFYFLEDVPAGEYSFAFCADKYETKDGITASFTTGAENRLDAVLNPEVPDNSGLPFIATEAWVSGEEIEMSGCSYSDAVIFRMGYTGLASTGSIAEVVYNFQGKYSSMSFDAGFYDGWERDATMTIIADGATIYDKLPIKYEDVARRYTISLAGVHQLVIHFESHGYDKTKYAIGDISLTRASATSGKPLTSMEGFDDKRYLAQYVDVVNGDFSMGGYNYRGGYIMRMGYGWTVGYEAKLGFNLKGESDTFSFEIARYPEGGLLHYIRPAYLTIEVDGVAVAGYDARELKWSDISLPIQVNVSGARQIIIKLKSDGYDTVKWGIGNVQM